MYQLKFKLITIAALVTVLTALLLSSFACRPAADIIGFFGYIENTGKRGFFTINSDGSNLNMLSQTDSVISPVPRQCWAADAGKLVYLEKSDDNSSDWVCVVEADGKNRKKLCEVSGISMDNICISPNGEKILFSVEKTESIQTGEGNQIKYIRKTQSELMSVDVNSGEIKQITDTPDITEQYAVYAPDSRRIAFIDRSAEEPQICTLYTMRADGGTPHKVADFLNFGNLPVELYWAADGKKIFIPAITYVFSGDELYSDIIYIDIPTSTVTNLTNTEITSETNFSVSPDSSKIVYSSYPREYSGKTYIMDIYGNNRFKIDIVDSLPCWHPGGQSILYTQDNKIFVMDNQGSNRKIVFDGGSKYPVIHWAIWLTHR